MKKVGIAVLAASLFLPSIGLAQQKSKESKKATIARLEGEVVSLRGQNEQLQAKIDSLNKNLGTSQAKLDSLNKNLEASVARSEAATANYMNLTRCISITGRPSYISDKDYQQLLETAVKDPNSLAFSLLTKQVLGKISNSAQAAAVQQAVQREMQIALAAGNDTTGYGAVNNSLVGHHNNLVRQEKQRAAATAAAAAARDKRIADEIWNFERFFTADVDKIYKYQGNYVVVFKNTDVTSVYTPEGQPAGNGKYTRQEVLRKGRRVR